MRRLLTLEFRLDFHFCWEALAHLLTCSQNDVLLKQSCNGIPTTFDTFGSLLMVGLTNGEIQLWNMHGLRKVNGVPEVPRKGSEDSDDEDETVVCALINVHSVYFGRIHPAGSCV